MTTGWDRVVGTLHIAKVVTAAHNPTSHSLLQGMKDGVKGDEGGGN